MSNTTPPADSRSVAKPAKPVSRPEKSGRDEDQPKPPAPDPTRYGDWEKNGRCIDF